MKMNNSRTFKQALCLLSLLIVICDSKGPMKKNCFTARIMKENGNLLNKTAEFKLVFPDDLTSIRLLNNVLKKEFMDNCSTRIQLLSFYTNDVLSADMISPEAQKFGIGEAFLRIEDMIKQCGAIKCKSNRSTEETEGMKGLREKIAKITLKEKLHKAINEMDMLLIWINSFISDIKKKGH